MSKDPYQVREAEKYISPIPSREYILMHISKYTTPISREEIACTLDLTKEHDLESLRRRLRAMERDGQLVFTRRQCYALPERLELKKGIVIGHRDGYGFIRIEGNKDNNDLFLSSEQMKLCIHGDVVLVQCIGIDRRGRREARIVRILEPKQSQIVGRYFTNAGISFVIPNDTRLSFDILIPQEFIANARTGYIVVVELTQRPTRFNKAMGKVVEVLGDNMGAIMAVDIALRTHEIPYYWPEKVQKQLMTLNQKNTYKEITKERIDLRDLLLVTIDSEDTYDFDDAVYCEKKFKGGWCLWVAIADVSYYVRPNTAIDNEARSRGNSIYFPSQVIPMLPEILSNNICSLKPQVDRLCVVCEMTVSITGRLTSFKFYEAVIRSYARLTYTTVSHILTGETGARNKYHRLIKPLEELHNLYHALDKSRLMRGGITFDTAEARFIFNSDHRIKRIESTIRDDTHKMIEECMILANIAAARFVGDNKEPVLYRIHDRPKDEHLLSLRRMLGELGLFLGGGIKPEPKYYATLIDEIISRPDYEMLQAILLRSMRQAVYDPKNCGHFGLALSAYVHFTSPIRRYPDLSLHRSIKYLLAKNRYIDKDSWIKTGGCSYKEEQILQLGKHCSMTERRADEAVRNVIDWLKCDFMQDQVGEIFTGIISSITGFGFFVRLDNLLIDGLVHISILENDYYYFDDIKQCLIGQSSGTVYRLGDKVKICVDAVHMNERKISFVLISSIHNPDNTSKTKKNRLINNISTKR